MATSNNLPRQENYPNSVYSDIYARADQLAGVNPGRPTKARTAMQAYPSKDYKSQYNNLYNFDTGLAATAAPSPSLLSTDPTKGYQSPYKDLYNFDTDISAAASTAPAKSFQERYNDTEVVVNPPPEQPATAYRSGPSEKVANYTALGGLGLGALSYLENRKTAKIQRESMKQDLATAREHNQNRRDSLASFNSGW